MLFYFKFDMSTVKYVREYFEKYGEVLDTTLKTDPSTDGSWGFGFVLFEKKTWLSFYVFIENALI